MGFIAEVAGEGAVRRFADARARQLTARYRPAVESAGDDPGDRALALAGGLTADGYAASTRPLAGNAGTQLCQGHCPVQGVAAAFPQLCEAEAQAFSELLGVRVTRLATLAHGEHVCTTHVPPRTEHPGAVRRSSPRGRQAPARTVQIEESTRA